MDCIRVLIVSDSVVIRRLLTDVLTAERDFEVAGTAATGEIALAKIPLLTPHVVFMSAEMPQDESIETTRRMRDKFPSVPVILCTPLSEQGADETLRALEAGAADYIAKPSGPLSREHAVEFIRTVLFPKLRAVVAPNVPSGVPGSNGTSETFRVGSPRVPRTVTPVSIVAIGSSTGGPSALAEVLRSMPSDLGVPIVIVQHMPPLFTKMLAERLTATTPVRTFEAAHGEEVLPSCAYIAPGDYHVELVRDRATVRIALNQRPPENSCRPAVDVTFASVAALYGPEVLAAVLTGMGQDGTRGARAIVEAGGIVLTQDRESCVVPSMPTSIVKAGLSDAVVKLSDMGAELTSRVRRGAFLQSRTPRAARSA